MKLIRWLVALLAAFLTPGLAVAACEGRDLMAELARDDPAAHAGVLERGAGMVNGQGKLWEVSKPGVAPSIVLGTYHDTGIAEEPLPAAAVFALDNARALMVEITPEEQGRLQKRIATDPTFAFSAAPQPWVEMLSAEERVAAEAALAERGLTLQAASRMRPWMLMSVLGAPQCQLAEMASGKPVLDTMLALRAKEKGVPVLGLEEYTDALAAFDLIDIEELRALTLDMLAQVGNEEDLRATLTGLYREGEIGAIYEYSIFSSGQLMSEERARAVAEMFRSAIITHRNRQWMDTLEAELEKGNVFVAFGALHLVGEEGVVALLRDRGWDVLRLDG